MRLGKQRVTFPAEPVPRPASVRTVVVGTRVAVVALAASVLLQAAVYEFGLAPVAAAHAVLLRAVAMVVALCAVVFGVGLGFLMWLMDLTSAPDRPAAARSARAVCGAVLAALAAVAIASPTMDRLSHAGLARVCRRGEPIIAAIRCYEADHGGPPTQLGDLVPDYLTGIPRPGIGMADQFRYSTGFDWPTPMPDGEWCLSVRWSALLFDYFVLFYWPNEDYPARWDSEVERIGRWACTIVRF